MRHIMRVSFSGVALFAQSQLQNNLFKRLTKYAKRNPIQYYEKQKNKYDPKIEPVKH